MSSPDNRGPVDATVVPRFAGPPTFARLPRLDEVERADVAVMGVPFDCGVSYRPGARFGPGHIRASSRLLRDLQPGPGRRAVRGPAGRRRRRHRLQPVRHRGRGAADRRRRPRGARPQRQADHHRRRPHDRAAAAAGDARAARADRGGPLRRAPRHLGHLLRCTAHPRDAVPPRLRGGADRQDRQHARRDPRAALLPRGPHRRPGARLPGDRRARHGRPRLARRRRADPEPRRRPADVRLARHRRPRPGLRARHRHARGRGTDQPRAAQHPALLLRAQPGRRRHRRGRPGLRPRRGHRHRGRARRLRAGQRDGDREAGQPDV